MDEKRIAHLWLLIACLNASKFAIAELDVPSMKMLQKQKFNQLRNTIQSFLDTMSSAASKQDKELLHSMSFENVGAMAETIGMISQLPEPQIEWFLNEVNKLVFAAVNRELSKK